MHNPPGLSGEPLIRFLAELAIIKKRTRIARIARMDKPCIREIRVIRVRCKNQLVLCFVGAVLAWLVQFLLGWCSSCSGKRQSRAETTAPHNCMLCWCTACLVGAVLAWLVQLRQLHPLRHPLKVST